MDDDMTEGAGRRQGNDLTGFGTVVGDRPLAGRRVLIAEDNVILSMHVAEVLERAGAEVVGPYPFVVDVMAAVDRAPPDLAVLDHELMDDTSDRVANRLGELGVPYAYFTSHERSDVPCGDDVPVVSKPNAATELVGVVSRLLD